MRLDGTTPETDSHLAASCVTLLVLIGLLAGCGGGGTDGTPASDSSNGPTAPVTPPQPETPVTSISQWNGRFVGTAKMDDKTYFADAQITTDGAVRIYIGAPDGIDGALQLTAPASSEQFVGNLELKQGQALGKGVVIGQQCAVSATSRFCNQSATATIMFPVQSGAFPQSHSDDLLGNISVATGAGQEEWALDLQFWSWPPDSSSAVPAGQFNETQAEFAVGGDVIVTVDASGAMAFLSPHSGCVGNGALAPHPDTSDTLWDATLTVSNCMGAYAYLNGTYDGLATPTLSSYWSYDFLLRVWLSKRSGNGPAAALTMLSEPI